MKGAIFDMDGLLFDTENIYQETWNELAAENSVTLGLILLAISVEPAVRICAG